MTTLQARKKIIRMILTTKESVNGSDIRRKLFREHVELANID